MKIAKLQKFPMVVLVGFLISISTFTRAETDFNTMMKQAPILDIKDPKFSKKSADSWNEKMFNKFSADMQKSSPDFQASLLNFFNNIQGAKPEDPASSFIADAKKIEAWVAKTEPEIFVKEYLAFWMKTNSNMAIAMVYADKVLRTLGIESDSLIEGKKLKKFSIPKDQLLKQTPEWRKEKAAAIREFEVTARSTIYLPVMVRKEILVRTIVWEFLDTTAKQLEAVP